MQIDDSEEPFYVNVQHLRERVSSSQTAGDQSPYRGSSDSFSSYDQEDYSEVLNPRQEWDSLPRFQYL